MNKDGYITLAYFHFMDMTIFGWLKKLDGVATLGNRLNPTRSLNSQNIPTGTVGYYNISDKLEVMTLKDGETKKHKCDFEQKRF